jgi:Rho-binding antiterminator
MSESPDGSPYTPIDCDRYSEIELAVMQCRRVRLRWREGNIVHDRTVLPFDLETRHHEEFLIVQLPDTTRTTIRLDHILLWETP